MVGSRGSPEGRGEERAWRRRQTGRTRTGGACVAPKAPDEAVPLLVAAMVVGIVFSAGAQAAPGDLDPTFSGDGKQTTDFGFGVSSAAATVRQPDGKIVAVGTDGRHRRQRLRARPLQPERLARHELLRRRQADDRLRGRGDGATGWRSRPTARSSRSVSGGTGSADFALARYNPNGSLDTSFSGDGKQTTDFGGCDGANGVAIQGDGKIVAVGCGDSATAATSRSPATTRTARSTRASPATASRRPTSGVDDAANGVAIQGDGKIVAVGGGCGCRRRLRARPLQPERLARHELLRRRQADDRLRGLRRRATGVALQGDGKIVAVGDAAAASSDFALARYNPNGSLDTSFSGDGKQTTDFGGRDEASGVALQGDGKIVAVGRGRAPARRLRARPLQPERVARHELLRRRQADDRLRGQR